MQIRNKRSPNKGQIIIYQGQNGPVSLNIDVSSQTIWASQSQISDMFGINQSVVSRHINNIFTGDEVERKSNMQKIHIANSDKPVSLYSLDILLAVGYRANSSKAIEFRKWSTLTLKKYITEGYAVNNQLIKKNYTLFQSAIDDLRRILPDSTSIETVGVLKKAKILNTLRMSPEVLTTLTILVAESRTRDKDRMVRIILLLLTTPQ